jgi:biotin synthase
LSSPSAALLQENQVTSFSQQLANTYHQPFPMLLQQAMSVHRQHHDPCVLQLAQLANIKSGQCPEDCSYCPQSIRYNTGVETWDLPTVEDIREQALQAKATGSSRFCMGAAWRTPPSEKHFTQVLALVKEVRSLGLEACVTLGMVNAEQAKALKQAGLTAYNHNLDSSERFYKEIITTRTYQDRLDTLKAVGDAGLQVCCGGILGLGETVNDRLALLETLCHLPTLPESVPVNCLVPVAGTPLEAQAPVDVLELVRYIATVRIFLPKAKVRLSAGRLQLSEAEQALCFLAGANSLFSGETLLTTPNPEASQDAQLLKKLGLQAQAPTFH